MKNENQATFHMFRGDRGEAWFACRINGKEVDFRPVLSLPSHEKAVDDIAVSGAIFRLNLDERDAVRAIYSMYQRPMFVYYEIVLDAISCPYSRRDIEAVMRFDLTKDEIAQCNAILRQLTYIYLIKDARTGLVKIGRTGDPTQRLKSLIRQDTLLPEPNEFSFIRCWEAYPYHEKLLHERFAGQRVRGEWFRLDDDDIHELDSQFIDAVQWMSGTTGYEDYERGLAASEAAAAPDYVSDIEQ